MFSMVFGIRTTEWFSNTAERSQIVESYCWRITFPATLLGIILALTLPEVKANPNRQTPMSRVKQNNRILIVEDDASIRAVMTRHFRRNGYEVEQAAAAEEAAERFSAGERRFDVVVTDVHLPGESGVDLARRIHEMLPGQPIVFMTGDSDARIARRALADGAAGYLLKPFELFELDAVVNHAVQRPAVQTSVVRRDRSAHVTLPPKVVLRPALPPRPMFAVRARLALTTAAMLGLAWLAGVGIAA
jgi:CheY-like chemotaxis protein